MKEHYVQILEIQWRCLNMVSKNWMGPDLNSSGDVKQWIHQFTDAFFSQKWKFVDLGWSHFVRSSDRKAAI